MAIDFQPIQEQSKIDFKPIESQVEVNNNPIDQFRKGVYEGIKSIPVVNKILDLDPEYKQRAEDFTAQPTGTAAKIARTIGQAAPDFIGQGAVMAALPEVGIPSTIARLGASGAIYQGAKSAAEGKQVADVASDAATAGVLNMAGGVAGKVGATIVPKALPFAERIGSAAGQYAFSKISGQDDTDASTQALLGAAFPMKRINVNNLRNNVAKTVLSPELSPDKGDIEYGHDPRRVVTEQGITANNAQELSTKISEKIKDVGSEIEHNLLNHKESNTFLNVEKSITKPIDEKLIELNKNPDVNKAAIERLKTVKQNLLNDYDESGKLIRPINFSQMTAKDIFDFRRAKLDPLIKYTGSISDDAHINQALQETRRGLVNKVNNIMPEVKDLNRKYGDLKAADDSVDRLLLKEEKQGIGTWKDWASAIMGSHAAGAPGAISAVAAEREFDSLQFKTAFAKWLYVAPQAEKASLLQAIPSLKDIIQKVYAGSQELGMAGRTGTSKVDASYTPEIVENAPKGLPSPETISEVQNAPIAVGKPKGTNVKFYDPNAMRIEGQPLRPTSPKEVPLGGEKDPFGFLQEAKNRMGQEGKANASALGLTAGATALGALNVEAKQNKEEDRTRLKLDPHEYTKTEEGFKDHIYDDGKGNKTIGYGFNLEEKAIKGMIPLAVRTGLRKLTKQEADKIFPFAYNLAKKDAIKYVGERTWNKLTDRQKQALIDMSYNMGGVRLNKFRDMKVALQNGNYSKAKKELLASNYAKQLQNRARRNSILIQGA